MLVESSPHCGGVAERLKAAVLKTAEGQPSVSSNLTSSAIFYFKSLYLQGFFLPVEFVGPPVGPLCTTLGHLHHKLSAQRMKAAPWWLFIARGAAGAGGLLPNHHLWVGCGATGTGTQ